MNKFITRRPYGKKFRYYGGDMQITDPVVLDRIVALAIPPAWSDVTIASSPRSKIQATGYDKAGRKQAIYDPGYRAKQEAAKFERIVSFARHLPAMREQIESDLRRKGLPKEKVLACVVKLMDNGYFRVGNDIYAKEHQTYGITTVRSRHTDVHGSHVTFDFTGKSGKQHHKTITDRQIAHIVRRLDELPGYEVFKYFDENGVLHPVNSHDVNLYLKEHMGEEYTAKDFRTWGGTMEMTARLAHEERPETVKDRKKIVTAAVKQVAKLLGNTPAVARNSYIDPRIIEAYESSTVLADTASEIGKETLPPYFQPEELLTLRVLEELS